MFLDDRRSPLSAHMIQVLRFTIYLTPFSSWSKGRSYARPTREWTCDLCIRSFAYRNSRIGGRSHDDVKMTTTTAVVGCKKVRSTVHIYIALRNRPLSWHILVLFGFFFCFSNNRTDSLLHSTSLAQAIDYSEKLLF